MELENEVPKDSNYPGRKQRTMSCPARVTVPGEQLRLGSWSNIGGFTELRRDFFPTIKTLSMLFIYLLMSSPLCIMTAIFSDCRCHQKGKKEFQKLETCDDDFGELFAIFYRVFNFFLIIYPYVWLLLDKQFARKTCRMMCSNMMMPKSPKRQHQSMIH